MKFGNPQRRLDKKLVKAAERGNVPEVIRLLDAGANVNGQHSFYNPPLFAAAYAGDTDAHRQTVEVLLARGAEVDQRNSVECTALMGAANQGHFGIAQILLAAGADRSLRGRDKDALGWALTSGSPEMIALFQQKPAEPVVEGPQEIVLRRPLGNRLMEEVFDFAARERITLIRKGEDGPVEAVTRDGFSDIEDRSRLREAFALYVKKGGTADEAAVFGDLLAKPKHPHKGL
jgi:hypothetical protein